MLAPGWRGAAAAMQPWTAGLQRRGFDAMAIRLPFGGAERALPRFLEEAGPDTVIGGQSLAAGWPRWRPLRLSSPL